ncbi:sigma-70 family RNA polymerase sigma factor [Flavobacteriaceae bacterium S0862]|nr:sigma-70 family RNA polymerase sigma factor [Flavobacteriaceae bacterium S0862]
MTKNLRTQELTERPLNELFQNYWTEVYSFAKSQTRNHHKAEDLTCETFTKAFLKIESYNPNKQFKNWIFTICKNTFLDNRRKASNTFSYLEDQLYSQINDTSPSPADQMILKEQYSNALNAISQLGKGDKQIITLYYLDDLSYNQISADLNISYANARTRLNRAKHRLRSQLN